MKTMTLSPGRRGPFFADLPSALVVFLIALPLCLGIALASGAPLFSGIISGVVGGIVIGSLSGSQVSVSGPAAGLTTIVAAGIARMPVYEAFLLSVVIAGCVQLLLGFLKAGVLGDYVPSTVIKGMLAAIGLILILKQVPHLIGYDTDFEGDETFRQADSGNTLSSISRAMQRITPLAALIGGVSLMLFFIWDSFVVKLWKPLQFLPAPLVVVLGGVFMQEWLAGGNLGVLKAEQFVRLPVAESAGQFFSFFRIPDPSFLKLGAVWTTAVTIAIVASLETLLSIEASDRMDVYKRVTSTDRELKAQGVGNIVAGMLGGLPLTSVIVRSSANINSGAKSRFSTIFHGIMLLGLVATIPALLDRIPLASLAAILIYTGFKLAKPAIFRELYRKGVTQFMPFVITIIAILFTDLLIGIGIGIAVGLIFVMRSNFKTALVITKDRKQFIFRLRKDVSFLNKPLLKRKLEEVAAGSSVLIDMSAADFIDQDVEEVVSDFTKHARLSDIYVEVRRKHHAFVFSKNHAVEGVMV